MRTLSRAALTATLAAALAAGPLLAAGTAQATPGGPGVTGTIIARATVGGTDLILREVTIPPGQATGWHYHDGPLRGYVKQGTLSHFASDCRSDGVYEAGSPLSEPAGADYVHIGRNLGTTPVVLEVLYILPHGAPLSEDAPNPGCDFE